MILAVTGHRPPKIGGYDPAEPMRVWVRDQLVLALRTLHPVWGITGMALGVDQDFAQVCADLGIPFTAAVPCTGHDATWPDTSRRYYKHLLACAAEIFVVSPGPYAPWKMQVRNEWMVDHADEVLAVWDGSSGGTANCVAYVRRVGKNVRRIFPGREFYWVSCPLFTCGVTTNHLGRIVETAPILWKFVGQPFTNLMRWRPGTKAVRIFA